jgi:hypothetical protein
MTTKMNQKIEDYLSALERVLKPLPVSERAEIVTEIKSHILSALERDPQAPVDSVIDALGSPEIVANRYLMERGLTTAKPPISPIVKWIVIGFITTFALFVLLVSVLIFKFTPLVKVDEKSHHVSVLGGLFQVDGDGKMSVSEMGNWNFGKASRSFDGTFALQKGKEFLTDFSNGKLDIQNSETLAVVWHCKTTDDKTPIPQATTTATGGALALDSLPGVSCTILVPEGAHFILKGSNGKVDFDDPAFDVKADLSNGKVSFTPDSTQTYKYDVQVKNGRADEFHSSDRADAHAVSIHLINGMISLNE